MIDARTALRLKKKNDLSALKQTALAALEWRGYEVRGKTTTQIKQALSRRPTKPVGMPPIPAA
jgi:hypothetical protein